jgi:Arc/MetJ-type ribon-helix-helix transcriptional regulator
MQPPASVQRAHPVQQSGSSETPKGLGITSSDVDSDTAYKYEKFNSDHPPRDPPSRAQSQLQVRDLQDQMKGLHIKISTLKVKAQEDNLRRRSLQSLRTPSPFTEGDHQWYPSALELKNSNGSLRSNPGRVRTPEPQENHHHQERREHETVRREAYDQRNHRSEQPEAKLHRKPSAASHTVSLNESLYEDAEEGEYSSGSEIDREALEEILREPLDEEDLEESLEAFPAVPQHTEMTPHEEREDAFDYEHFILHSALGNYSRSKLRRPSNVSTSSVETTRPYHEASGTRHSRSDSTTSLSTIATFATATEGDDDIESVLYWDRKFNAGRSASQRKVAITNVSRTAKPSAVY